MSTRIATVVGCVGIVATLGAQPREAAHAPAPKPSEFATISTLPSFGRGGDAVAIDEAGTFIAGHVWDESGVRHAVEWTLQADGSWAIHELPWPAGATRTFARGVNNRGDVAGDDLPVTLLPSHALLWLAGTGAPLILNCPTDHDGALVYAISAEAQVVVGNGLLAGESRSTAAVWQPGGICREDLPLLLAEGSGAAFAVNADGTIVGGGTISGATGVPVRWTKVADEWRIEQLDTRTGEVRGANAKGDLAGYVMIPCTPGTVCQRAFVWYTTGASRELGTLGGRDSLGLDINSAGEVVGISMPRRGINTAFFWSPDALVGMVQLPVIGRSARANALSDVRPDGTRVAVGVSEGKPVVWVIRNP
jgi:uncharacterized membrane protein